MIPNVPLDIVKAMMFQFSLVDKAKQWYHALPRNTIHTWADMVKEFYDQYFPYGKISLVKKEIGEFRVGESETLWQAWRRYQDLLLKCP